MNLEEIKKLSCYQGIDFDAKQHRTPDPEPEVDGSQLKAVLDEIFSVDPVSGLPKGDIQYYLSSDGNPQVKQWLETNLLKPRMSSNQTMKGLTDDVINEFGRKADESVSDYQARLMTLYDSAKAEVIRLKNPEPPKTE